MEIKRTCLYCGVGLLYDTTRTKEWNEKVGRKFCGKVCFQLHKSCTQKSTYLRMYLIGGKFIAIEVYKKLMLEIEQEVKMTLQNFTLYVSQGINPDKGFEAMKVAMLIGKALYKTNNVYFKDNYYDYRRCFKSHGGVWICKNLNLTMLNTTNNLDLRFGRWSTDYGSKGKGAERTKGEKLSQVIYRKLRDRLESRQIGRQYQKTWFQTFFIEYRKDETLLTCREAKVIGEGLDLLNLHIDYRSLLPEMLPRKYGSITSDIGKFI